MNRNVVSVLLAVLALIVYVCVLAGVTGSFDAIKALAVAGLLLAISVLI